MIQSLSNPKRDRRGSSDKFIIDGPATRKPSDFSAFLSNDQNKMQLCQLLLKVWGGENAVSKLKSCGKAVLVVEGKAYELVPDESKVGMSSSKIFAFTIDK